MNSKQKKEFTAFLQENNDSIADLGLEITAEEIMLSSKVCQKKIKIWIYMHSRITKQFRDKKWQTSIVYKLKKCGFKFNNNNDGSNIGHYEIIINCKPSY